MDNYKSFLLTKKHRVNACGREINRLQIHPMLFEWQKDIVAWATRKGMKVVFVSGAYRGNVAENIEKAKQVAIKLWEAGYVALCPHLNTAFFDGICPDEVWLAGDIELLKRCDAISMVDGWEKSEGARYEHELAEKRGMEFILV